MSPDLYSRLVDDPGFRRRVEMHHSGDDDLVDVAWWLNHPDEESPSGRPSPAQAIRELQHQLYARSTSEENRHTAAEALHELQEKVAASQARLMEAVARAEAHAAPALAASDTEAVRPRKWWWSLAAAGGAAIIAAIGFGAGLVAADSNAAPVSSPPTASPTTATPPVVSAFDQPQAAEDIPEWIPAGFKNETFRSVTPQMEDSEARTFVARDDTNMICLVVIVPAAEELFSSCALEHDIPLGGLRVQYREHVQGVDGARGMERIAYVTLKHDGIEGGGMDTPIQG